MEIPSTLYREAFARSDAGMAMLSPAGDWLAVNPAMCRLLQRPVDVLTGARAHDVLFDAESARWIATLCGECAPVDTAPADGVRELGSASGQPLAWRASLTPLTAGEDGDAAFLLQLEPVHPAVRSQAEADALRTQEHIAFGISHDLRAPLRSIAGFAARLDEAGVAQEPGPRADLARIRAAAARAERLIEELLELLRVPRQSLRDEEVDLSLLCEWIAADLQDADPGRAATVEVPPGLIARGDEHWLKVMLHKLLENAWKFSAGRERVEITVEGEVIGDRLHLSIHDRGSGFDMRYADKLFLPFQRLHGADQGGGSGLGLAVAQQVAQRHGGSIHASSQPGLGSTFDIELPAVAGPTADQSIP